MTESDVQALARLRIAHAGHLSWRNNNGAAKLANGSYVRWGLANDSKQLNERIKSADLIGIERVLIMPDMVGQYIGRFLSVECKASDWRYSGTVEENAQMAWAQLINDHGGRAVLITDPAALTLVSVKP